ncbi:TPA: TIGR03751 family conjugal transfer lipoprotein [Legionella pneumophila]|nr:TIGR03751 family conjugal transfer lipoprotein [Legionella pneumophila]HBB6940308.1 TIGR03751 family conjugal transfer lipoprotein [Legionella pneumophila]
MATINLKNLIMLCASLSLCACSTAKMTSGTIPEQGLTVSQLYQHSQQPVKSLSVQRVSVQQTQPDFKALDNPEIPIHVFAHVANIGDEQIIKPAYTTRFFLYKQNQYALASELY